MTLQEMRQNKMSLVTEARKLNDLVTGEKREYTGEESEHFERLMTEVAALDAQITAAEAAETRSAFLAQADDWARQPQPRKAEPADIATAVNAKSDFAAQAFRKYLRSGLNPSALSNVEYRAIAQDSDSTGGALHAPAEMSGSLSKSLDEAVFVRQHAQKLTVSGSDTIRIPTMTADVDLGGWTTETGALSAESQLAFGNVDIVPQLLTGYVVCSLKMLRMSGFPIESFINERLAYQFAHHEEQGFLTGAGVGSNEPLGIFTTAGTPTGYITTARDKQTGLATGITADGLVNAVWHLNPKYHSGARWCFSPTAMGHIHKLKDGNGYYMLIPSFRDGPQYTLLGFPIDVSANVPSAFTSGTYCGALCNWRVGYAIAELGSLELQRCNELLAASSNVAIIGRTWISGAPLLAEAFVRCITN